MKLFAIIFISILSCSCNKEDIEAPPITEENTFSCKINGELFIAQPNGGFLQSPGILVIGPNWVLRLKNQKGQTIYINLEENEPDDKLQILRADGDHSFFYDENNSVELVLGNNVYISHANTGFVKIIEWVNDNILIFKFDELTLYQESDPTKTIILTDGKLNINLATLNKD